MGVDLSGRDIAMAEQHLTRAEVGAPFEQVGGEGVAKDVRADPVGRDAGSGGKLPHELVEPYAAQMLAAGREGVGPLARPLRPMLGAGGAGAVRDRDQPLAPALALEDQERAIR